MNFEYHTKIFQIMRSVAIRWNTILISTSVDTPNSGKTNRGYTKILFSCYVCLNLTYGLRCKYLDSILLEAISFHEVVLQEMCSLNHVGN